MYNQVIGPDENSNTAMKASTRMTVGFVHELVASSLSEPSGRELISF
jgi:hypothetical protein